VEAELFGREKGAYLDGESRQVGLLELGRGSTVFFDEVADLTPDLQASLARVLQTKEIVPLGSTRPIKVDFKVIAATRHDLAAAIEDGSFRDDLYYRLNVLSIHVPPLRERAEDIPQLVWRFVDEFSAAYGKTIETIDHESMEQLQRYDWPGNARELRNVVERAMIVATGRRLRIALPSPGGAASPDADTLAAVEKAHIAAILGACRGQITGPAGAAARLGLTPRALEAKLVRYGIRRRKRLSSS
jgi:formate hydrogenlyase transcriptional activator